MKYPYVLERILDFCPGVEPHDVMWRLRQSTYVSVSKRYMYFEVPKAASTLMINILRRVEGAGPIKLFADEANWETRRDMFVHARSNSPLPSLVEIDNGTQREVLEAPDFLRMTVVRNPYSRLLSSWSGKVLVCEPNWKRVYLGVKGHLPDVHETPLISFNEFVEYVGKKCHARNCDPHWRLQIDYTSFPAMNFSLVARLEQLDEGLKRFADHLGLSESLVARGKNESLPVGTASYSEELADNVYSLYRKDFEMLGYDRNTWARVGEHSSEDPRKPCVSEERFRDEIIERNLIILGLYEERRRLRTQLQWVSRLRLGPAIEGMVALHSFSRKAARKLTRLARQVLRRRSQMQKAMLP